MGKRKRVGIKYCGGCNPTYERVEMVQKIQFFIGDRFLFLPHDQQDLDGLVLVSGCHRACARENLEDPEETPYRSITEESDFKKLVDWLADLGEKGDV